jgi:hypothetical protein
MGPWKRMRVGRRDHTTGVARGGRSENSRGAVLVEAAMVLPLILVILIGTFEFGLSMSNLISVRQGVRDTARSAVVATYDGDTSCTLELSVGNPGNVETQKVMCDAKNQIRQDEARVRIKLAFPDGAKTPPPDDNSLLICAEYKHNSPTGMFGSLLNNRVSKTQVVMRVEQDLTAVGAGEETSLSGSWAWCG